MGKSFGLLRLPRMPEIRAWKERVAKARERQEKGKAGEDDEMLVQSSWQDRDMNVRNLFSFPHISQLTSPSVSGTSSPMSLKPEKHNVLPS